MVGLLPGLMLELLLDDATLAPRYLFDEGVLQGNDNTSVSAAHRTFASAECATTYPTLAEGFAAERLTVERACIFSY